MSTPNQVDVVIVGAGFAGMYMLHRLRGLGLSARRVRGREQASAAPGTGTATRARGATSRAGVFLLVLARARAGVEMERALRRPARNPALCQPRRRPARPAARHPVRYARDRGASSTRPRTLGRSRPTAATRCRRAHCVMATGCLSTPHGCRTSPGLDSFKGPT